MRLNRLVRMVVLMGVCTPMLVACASDHRRHWSANGTPRSEDWHSPAAALMKYDANHDGTLTREELEKGLHAEFDAIDTKHTGCLTQEQVEAINEARLKNDAAAASPIIDWKQNGCVDFDEYAATMRSLFEQIDRNGDGKITADELKPPRQRRPQPQRIPGSGY